jgi:PAS domain S-box-containing protein
LLFLLSLTITEWTAFYILQVMGANLPTKLLFGEAKYIGVAFTPFLWILFAINYATQSRHLTWRIVLPLIIIPTLTSILALTTERHRLFWSQPELAVYKNVSDFNVIYGPWYWVHLIYSYLLILAGTIIVFRTLRRSQGLHRQQAVALIVAVLAPWFGNILYFSGLNPFPYLDLTPFAFTITVTALTWAILGFQLVDLAPIARDLIVDEMKDGIIVLDAQNRIADINLSAERMIRLSAAQVIGRPAHEAFSAWPELVERYSQITDALDEVAVSQGAAANWLELYISPLYDRRKRFLGRVIVMRDITARKEMENALSLALAQAREASHLKDQLLARVSHELRTPLSSILGFAELMNMNSYGVLEESQKTATGQIIESAHYLNGVIDQLLDQAQLASETLILENTQFSLDELLQKVRTSVDGLARDKDLTFDIHLAPEVPKSLFGDMRRIEQILLNLVGNAVKFTQQGRVDLNIFLPDAAHWTIQVADTGPGIPEEAQAYIFEAFRLVNTAIVNENRGAGLGLSITRQLVELMKGSIQVESQPGRGSTFTVTLPLDAGSLQ